jgi:hypothetical protein
MVVIDNEHEFISEPVKLLTNQESYNKLISSLKVILRLRSYGAKALKGHYFMEK